MREDLIEKIEPLRAMLINTACESFETMNLEARQAYLMQCTRLADEALKLVRGPTKD